MLYFTSDIRRIFIKDDKRFDDVRTNGVLMILIAVNMKDKR